MKKRISKILNITGILMILLVIIVCIPLTVPNLLGYGVYNVISGSMEPTISTGSLIYVDAIEPVSVKEGDIIAFYGTAEQSSIITHRAVENRTVEGEIITKGDANEQNDMNPVQYTRVIGKVVYHIPFLGLVGQLISSVAGKIFIGVFMLIGFVLSLLSSKNIRKKDSV